MEFLIYAGGPLITLLHEYDNKNTIVSESRNRQELYVANQRNQESLMFSPDGILVLDTEDNLVLVN